MLSIPVKPTRRGDLAAALICLIGALLCYANTLGNGFCDDDLPIIVHNTLVTQPGQWWALWMKDYWHGDPLATPYRDLLYRPFTILTFRINHAVGGLGPWSYHLVNVLLHGLVTVLVFRLGRRILGSLSAALAAGLCFAVLPIHTEAVNNVVGRAELLAAAFTLASIELFTAPRRRWTMAAGLGCALAACLSKENGVAVLILVPLLTWVTIAQDRRRTLKWQCGGLSLVAGVYLVLRYLALGGALYQPVTLTKTVNLLADSTLWQRVCGAVQLWGLYWSKTVWPDVLCLDYSIHALSPADHLLAGQALIGVGVIALLGVFVWHQWCIGQRWPAVLLACLLVTYFPVSNTVVLIKTYFAERVWYLPSIWVALMVGWWAGAALGRSVTKPFSRVLRLVVPGLIVVAVAGSLVRCWLRNAEWKSPGTLYAAAYRDNPQAVRVLLLYGRWLAWNGYPDEGIELLKRATLIDLGFVDAQRTLGHAYLRAGLAPQALEHLQTADVQIPGHPPTQAALSEARRLVAMQSSGAIDRARQALVERPGDVEVRIALADEQVLAGLLEDALFTLQQGAESFADSVRFQHRLAVALVMTNRVTEAVEAYGHAIALQADGAVLRVELAMLLLDRRADGDLEQARRLSEAAWRLEPTSVPVGLCRAEVLALDGKRAEAATLYRSIADSLPPGSDLRRMCELKLAGLGQR